MHVTITNSLVGEDGEWCNALIPDLVNCAAHRIYVCTCHMCMLVFNNCCQPGSPWSCKAIKMQKIADC